MAMSGQLNIVAVQIQVGKLGKLQPSFSRTQSDVRHFNILEQRPTLQIPYAAGIEGGAAYKQYGVTRQ